MYVQNQVTCNVALIPCWKKALHPRLFFLDGGEVGVPHEGDQVGEEHPVLWSHQVDVHNLRKIYKESEVAFARQFWPVGLSRSSSWPARRSSSWTQPHFWHCHDWIPANGWARRGYFELKWPTIAFRFMANSRQHLQPWACPRGREWEGGRLVRRQVDLWEPGGFSRPSRCLGTTWESMIQQTKVNPTKPLKLGMEENPAISFQIPNN